MSTVAAFTQIIQPRIPTSNPNAGGRNYFNSWCLTFWRMAFGARGGIDTALDAWSNTQFKHDLPLPAGVTVLLWFAVAGIPAGHVVGLLPDGRVRSTGFNDTYIDFTNHAAFIARAQRAWGTVRLLGWSEDVNGVRFVASSGTAGTGGIPFPTTGVVEQLMEDIMIYISGTDRGSALIGMNGFTSLAPGEEVAAAQQLADRQLTGLSAARFDTMRDICTRGDRDFARPAWPKSAATTTVAADFAGKLADALNPKFDAIPTAAENAQATRTAIIK